MNFCRNFNLKFSSLLIYLATLSTFSTFSLFSTCASIADTAQPLSLLAQMPVKEITAFKDGHAFVIHQGNMPTDSDGNVVIDYLPKAVMGTFWPYASNSEIKLKSVIASQKKVLVPRTALSVKEFIEANPGTQVVITETKNLGSNNANSISYDAQIIGIPTRSGEEVEQTSPPNSGDRLPEFGDCVLIKTTSGITTLPLNRIEYITFKDSYKSKLSREEFRNLLTLKLDWSNHESKKNADVGIMYLQKGFRWIPEYKLSINGSGKAHLKLEATIINDIADINDVTTNLVVGVPSFLFKDHLDPISLQETAVQINQSLNEYNRSNFAFSNAVMGQMADFRQRGDMNYEGSRDESAANPEVSSSSKNEDLFVFTVKHVSLRKGQRMVLPIYESEIDYKDIYTLTLPFSPPSDIVRNFNHSQQSQIERMLNSPKFMHKIRLTNKSTYPLTTAPVLIEKDNKVLAQGMMTYTASGAKSDLAITNAIDLKIKKQDKEISRHPNAVTWQGDQYGKVDLTGTIDITNYSENPAEIEVSRYVLGKAEEASHSGKSEMINLFEDYEFMPDGNSVYPNWWSWYSWPHWWSHFNSVGKLSWHTTIKPKETINLNYKWSYFWR